MLVMSSVITTGRTTLRVLNVLSSAMGNDGILMISEELQYKNSLIELKVNGCGLSAKGQN